MFKHVVSLCLKPAVTTAHDHTVGVDACALCGQMMMIQSQKLWVITHIWPQEPPTAPKAVSADLRAACIVEAAATINGRSDASYGCGSFMVWVHCDASHTDRVKSRAFIMPCCLCHTRQDGKEGAAWQCWQAERGGHSGQRSATCMLVRLADRVLVLT